MKPETIDTLFSAFTPPVSDEISVASRKDGRMIVNFLRGILTAERISGSQRPGFDLQNWLEIKLRESPRDSDDQTAWKEMLRGVRVAVAAGIIEGVTEQHLNKILDYEIASRRGENIRPPFPPSS